MRSVLRHSIPAVAALLMLAPRSAPADPDPTQYWMVPYVQYGTISPNPPMPGESLTLHLVGYFPYNCGVISDTSVVGTRVGFTMRKASASCADTARSWSRDFPLGVLTAGIHTITIVRTLVRENDSVDVREASFEIRVGDDPNPPPPSCPIFSWFTTSPDPATHDVPTQVTLHGCYPYPCGEIVGSRILGPTHVEVTMQQLACSDSAQGWVRTFDLGLLPAGHHNLLIDVRDVSTPDVAQVFGTWLDVLGDVPPPPPPLPPVTGPLFTYANTVPEPPTTAEVTVLVANGIYPQACGFISNAEVLSASHVALTVRRGSSCAQDSIRVWSQPFNLGFLMAGRHDVRISLRDASSADSFAVQDHDTSFDVVDDGPPAPPPPPPHPVDSLIVTHPNPFATVTEFGLMVDAATKVQVGIYDLQGRLVKRIFDGMVAAGTSSFAWDGRRESGSRAPAGIYFYRVIQPGRMLARRVVLLPAQ